MPTANLDALAADSLSSAAPLTAPGDGMGFNQRAPQSPARSSDAGVLVMQCMLALVLLCIGGGIYQGYASVMRVGTPRNAGFPTRPGSERPAGPPHRPWASPGENSQESESDQGSTRPRGPYRGPYTPPNYRGGPPPGRGGPPR